MIGAKLDTNQARPRTDPRSAARIATCAVLLLAGRTAHADEPDAYCRRVAAQAAADASLQLAPRLGVQALRVPTTDGADVPWQFDGARGMQLRAFLSYSLANAYSGLLTLDLAEADCRRHAARIALADAMQSRESGGRHAAARKALAYLDAQERLVRHTEERAEVRHARHLTSAAQLDEVRGLALQYRRRRLELAEHLVRLDDAPADGAPAALSSLASSYARASRDFEEAQSDLRRVRRWDVSIRAGVVPAERVDYYGSVELTYNLGDLFQAGFERRQLAARETELGSAAYELPAQAERLERQSLESDALLRREVELRQAELRLATEQLAKLERSAATEKDQLLSVATLRRVLIEADLIYARELLAARAGDEAASSTTLRSTL